MFIFEVQHEIYTKLRCFASSGLCLYLAILSGDTYELWIPNSLHSIIKTFHIHLLASADTARDNTNIPFMFSAAQHTNGNELQNGVTC